MKLNIALLKLNTQADEIIPPISLGYLAGAITEDTTHIVDAQKDNLSHSDIIAFCKKHRMDVLGIQLWTKDIVECKNLFLRIKQEYPRIVTVIGGVQPSVMPVETFSFFGDCLDYAFEGESEASFVQLLNKLKNKKDIAYSAVAGLVYRENGAITHVPSVMTKKLDDLAFPAWELMPPKTYPHAPHGAFFKQFPIAPIITSRGCPYACTFCSAPILSHRTIRFRSIDNIFEEIDILYHKFGVRELHIEDDNFSIYKDFVLEFCDRMIQTKYNLTWAFPNGVRLDTLDDEVLWAMKNAGCYALNFGIETGSNESLEKIKKKITCEKILEKIQLAKNYDFLLGGFFILGFPWEDEAMVRQTIQFACDSKLDMAGFSYFQPFPGTELAKQLQESGEFHIDLASFTTSLHDISYVPPKLTREKLQKLRQYAMRSFYFRPHIIFNILRRTNSLQHYAYIVKRGLRWLTK